MGRAAGLSGEQQAYISRLEKENIRLKNTIQNNVIQFLEYQDQLKKHEEEVGTLKIKNETLKTKNE
jgi:hypothetical protein